VKKFLFVLFLAVFFSGTAASAEGEGTQKAFKGIVERSRSAAEKAKILYTPLWVINSAT